MQLVIFLLNDYIWFFSWLFKCVNINGSIYLFKIFFFVFYIGYLLSKYLFIAVSAYFFFIFFFRRNTFFYGFLYHVVYQCSSAPFIWLFFFGEVCIPIYSVRFSCPNPEIILKRFFKEISTKKIEDLFFEIDRRISLM